jgi:hypothetical protein
MQKFLRFLKKKLNQYFKLRGVLGVALKADIAGP